MKPKIIFALLVLSRCHADVSVNDFIQWTIKDIYLWDQYFPSRALEEEQQTNKAAIDGVQFLTLGLNSSLWKIVVYQDKELRTAQLMMEGTESEGCVRGLNDFMTNAINNEISSYTECTADAESNLKRLNHTWSKLKAKYLDTYHLALKGIDVCVKIYPNKNSIDRLKSCVEYMRAKYFAEAKKIRNSMFPSPSMSYFQGVVVECGNAAAHNVVAKGSEFLKMLLQCATLSKSIDIASYKKELSQWKGFNSTISTQILNAQGKNYIQVSRFKADIENYFDLQEKIVKNYVMESRGFDFYKDKIYGYLNDYYNTVTATSIDNPADVVCTDNAKLDLDEATKIGATKSLSCDVNIVNNIKKLMVDVQNNFLDINSQITSIGNVALLKCFARGYEFAPNTIGDCYNLTYEAFDINYSNHFSAITKEVITLSNYESSFINGSTLPCQDTTLQRIYLAADSALYRLQRCIYIASGTTYPVSTAPTTSTTSIYVTKSTPANSTSTTMYTTIRPNTTSSRNHSTTTQYSTTTNSPSAFTMSSSTPYNFTTGYSTSTRYPTSAIHSTTDNTRTSSSGPFTTSYSSRGSSTYTSTRTSNAPYYTTTSYTRSSSARTPNYSTTSYPSSMVPTSSATTHYSTITQPGSSSSRKRITTRYPTTSFSTRTSTHPTSTPHYSTTDSSRSTSKKSSTVPYYTKTTHIRPTSQIPPSTTYYSTTNSPSSATITQPSTILTSTTLYYTFW